MFSNLLNIWRVKELRNKILFTLGLLAIYRIGFYVPVPGVDQASMTGSGSPGGDLSDMFALFTGGTLSQSTIFGLGIMPYISASIIFQLLVTVIPALEKLQKEGETGRKKIQEYTRYATVGLCVIQAAMWMKMLGGKNWIFPEYRDSWFYYLFAVTCLTTGTLFLMWLGEQIDEYGIGNGISLIIMAGIVARMPNAVIYVWDNAVLSLARDEPGKMGPGKIIFLIVAFIGVVAGSILITQGQRRIPIQQAKQTRGRRVYGGQRNYLPLRVNHGGVMPIIFASTLMMFPGYLFRYINSLSFSSVWVFWMMPFARGRIFTRCSTWAWFTFLPTSGRRSSFSPRRWPTTCAITAALSPVAGRVSGPPTIWKRSWGGSPMWGRRSCR
jgi:preprotein translocase subunit SecY